MSSMFAKIGSWFAITMKSSMNRKATRATSGTQAQRRALDGSRARVGPSVAVFAPRGFSDVTEIADALRSRQVAIVNLQGADRTLLQRVVDFTSGVCLHDRRAHTKTRRIDLLVVPAGVNVNSANLREQMNDDGMLDLSARYGITHANER